MNSSAERLDALKQERKRLAENAAKLVNDITERKEHLRQMHYPENLDGVLTEMKANKVRIDKSITALKLAISDMQRELEYKATHYPKGVWAGCNKRQKKLIGAMINMIGLDKYKELADKVGISLSGEYIMPVTRDEAKEAEFEQFDRMMRGNYNKYAGKEI